MKRKAIIIAALILAFILTGVVSYFIGAKINNPTINKETTKTSITPTVTLEPTVTATESSEISPTVTLTPAPSATTTVTPTKGLNLPLLKRIATSTPTPTATPLFKTPILRTQ